MSIFTRYDSVKKAILSVPTKVALALWRAISLPFYSLILFPSALMKLRDGKEPFSLRRFAYSFFLYGLIVAAVPFVFIMPFTGKNMTTEIVHGVLLRDSMPMDVNIHRMVHIISRMPGFAIADGKLTLDAPVSSVVVHDPVGEEPVVAFNSADMTAMPELVEAQTNAAKVSLQKHGLVSYKPNGKKTYVSYKNMESVHMPAAWGVRLVTDAALPVRIDQLAAFVGLLSQQMPPINYLRTGMFTYAEPLNYKTAQGPFLFTYGGQPLISVDLDDETEYARTASPALVSVSADTIFYRRRYGDSFSSLFLPALNLHELRDKMDETQRYFRKKAVVMYWTAAVTTVLIALAAYMGLAALLALPGKIYLRNRDDAPPPAPFATFRAALLSILFAAVCFCAFPFFFMAHGYIFLAIVACYYISVVYRLGRITSLTPSESK